MGPRRHPSPSSRIQASQSFGDNFRHHCFLPSMDGSLRLATPGGAPVQGLRSPESPSAAVEAVAVAGWPRAFWKWGCRCESGLRPAVAGTGRPRPHLPSVGSPRPAVAETPPAGGLAAPLQPLRQERVAGAVRDPSLHLPAPTDTL